MRRNPRSSILRFWLAALLTMPATLAAADLNPRATQAWEAHIQSANARMQARLHPGATFLWIDQSTDLRASLRNGNIVAEPVDGRGMRPVPDALIHDWIGAAFIPNTSLDRVLEVVNDYDHYKETYAPAVVDSRALFRGGDRGRFSMCLVHKASVVTTAINAEYEVRTIRVDPHRAYATSQSTSIREISNYGKPGQEELPPGQGSGYIWRLYSVSRYDEREGGVYVELEVIALTRDIPGSLRWLVKPLVARMSRNSLLISLMQTRNALAPKDLISRDTPNQDRAIPPGSVVIASKLRKTQ